MTHLHGDATAFAQPHYMTFWCTVVYIFGWKTQVAAQNAVLADFRCQASGTMTRYPT